MNSLVSIIVPCFNQAQFLPEALQSVLEQAYENWECIIVNDGSPDNTHEVAQEWLAKDTRFKYIQKENGGLSSARNDGLDIASGSYIQFLDCDDVIHKLKLMESIQLLSSRNERNVKVVISNFLKFELNTNLTTEPYCKLEENLFNFESLLFKWDDTFTIPIHCGLFKASLFQDFRFPELLKAKEDWVMWVFIFQNNCNALFIDKPFAFYRVNPQSMTKTKDMLPDFIRALDYFKKILPSDTFHQLFIILISRYYKKNGKLKEQLNAVKNSNSYQTGLLIKKFFRKIGILKISKKLFPTVLKLKSK
jgi:glycosyltransferase involved in cell wall biosynthesis